MQKWLNGTINWQEERELEQLAKGDAMLADALEGVRILPESDHAKRVENLKTRLQKRTQQKPKGLIFLFAKSGSSGSDYCNISFWHSLFC